MVDKQQYGIACGLYFNATHTVGEISNFSIMVLFYLHLYQLPDESAGLIESPLQFFDESRKFRTTGVAPQNFTEVGATSSFVYAKHTEPHAATHADDDFDDVSRQVSASEAKA